MKPTLDLTFGKLRPTRREDAAFVLRLLTAPEVRIYLCDDVILTNAEVSAMLADSDRQDADGLGLWAIVSDQGGAVGVVGLAPVSGPLADLPGMSGGIEPVIALAPKHFGKGLALAALSAVMRYARDSLRVTGLVAGVDAPNEPSHRLMAARGFERSGRTTGEKGNLILYRVSFDASDHG